MKQLGPGISNFFIPAKSPEDWEPLLAGPRRIWKKGSSARALAYCWHEAGDFPDCVRTVFGRSRVKLFNDIRLLLAIPGYRVALPPKRSHAFHNDIFALALANNQLMAIMIEGRVSEKFGKTIAGWSADHSRGKEKRLLFLCNELGLKHRDVENIRYQLLLKAVSALTAARRFRSRNALLLFHSFSRVDDGFREFQGFLSIFGVEGKPDTVVLVRSTRETNLFLGWIRGDEKYLRI